MENLDDVDAVLVELIKVADQKRTLRGAEAIAVRAIVALSRAGRQSQARELMSDLLVARD